MCTKANPMLHSLCFFFFFSFFTFYLGPCVLARWFHFQVGFISRLLDEEQTFADKEEQAEYGLCPRRKAPSAACIHTDQY